MNFIKSRYFLMPTALIWLASCFYSIDLKKGETVIGQVKLWHLYLRPTETLNFIALHISFAIVAGFLIYILFKILGKTPNKSLKHGTPQSGAP